MNSANNAGRCCCGAVQFSFEGAPEFVSECVCESCRRAHGATVVPWLGVKTPKFKLDHGDDALSWYSSSNESERGFCTQCGTRLFFRSSKWPGEIHMALSCLDYPDEFKVKRIVFSEEMPEWSYLSK